MATKFAKWSKIYQNFQFKVLRKCTKNWGFGLKINHLATLVFAIRPIGNYNLLEIKPFPGHESDVK
jgi:hypothetical protein